MPLRNVACADFRRRRCLLLPVFFPDGLEVLWEWCVGTGQADPKGRGGQGMHKDALNLPAPVLLVLLWPSQAVRRPGGTATVLPPKHNAVRLGFAWSCQRSARRGGPEINSSPCKK
jgi:hypothetical protein